MAKQKEGTSTINMSMVAWIGIVSALDWELYRLKYLTNLVAIALFTTYFLVVLDMADKIFTFIISGKVVGTEYILKFSDVCLISAFIIAALLTRSVVSYLRVAKNRNKIKLQIKEAYPLALKIRVTA